MLLAKRESIKESASRRQAASNSSSPKGARWDASRQARSIKESASQRQAASNSSSPKGARCYSPLYRVGRDFSRED